MTNARWFSMAGVFACAAALAGCASGRTASLPGPSGAAVARGQSPEGSAKAAVAQESEPGRLGRVGKVFTAGFRKTSAAKSRESKKDPLRLSNDSEPTPRLLVTLAQLHERSGNTAAAQRQYEKALELDADDLDALLGLARLHDREANYAEATNRYREAVLKHPDSPAAHNDLGLCYLRQRRFDEAAGALQQAVRMQPTRTLYQSNLCVALVALGRHEEALQNMLAVHSEPVAQYNVGYLLHKNGQDALAHRYFSQALQQDPSFRQAEYWVKQLEPGRTLAAPRPSTVGPRYGHPRYSAEPPPKR